MKKWIEDFIQKLEKKKQQDETEIVNHSIDQDRALVILIGGKIIAYDYCINELKEFLKFYDKK